MAKAKQPASGSKAGPKKPKSAPDASDKPVTPSTDTASATAAKADTSDTKVTQDVAATGTDTPKPQPEKTATPEDTAVTTPIEAKNPDLKDQDKPAVSGIPKTKPTEAEKPKTTAPASVDAKGGATPDDAAKNTSKTDLPPKPTETPAPARSAPPAPSRSVFWPLVLGGVVAGGLGFVASEMNVLNTRVDTTEIREALTAQDSRIETLETAEPAQAEMPDLGELEATIASLDEMVSSLETRLAELESRPVPTGDSGGPPPEYAEDLAALRSSVEDQKAEIDRLLENALSVEEATANAARQAAVQSALTKVTVALNSGAGFADAVEELRANGVTDVPDPLAQTGDEGVPTLLALQTEFPDVARAALASARAAGTEDGEGGVGAFLKRQLGARSVAPREGSDPDAVLSRAEAAVRDGRIADALAEIDALPAPAQDAMADWLAAARSRAAAESAVQDLSQRLTAN